MLIFQFFSSDSEKKIRASGSEATNFLTNVNETKKPSRLIRRLHFFFRKICSVSKYVLHSTIIIFS